MSFSKKIFVIIVTLLFLLLSTAEVVQAIPSLPSSFHGTVKVNKANVEDGTLIEAMINDQVFAQCYTQTYNGDSVFVINIPGDDSSTTTIDGGKEGDIVLFKIGGIQVTQTGIWHAGTSEELNLKLSSTDTLNTPAPTPTFYPTQTAIVIVQITEVTQTPEIMKPISETSVTSTSIPPTSQPQSETIIISESEHTPTLSVINTQTSPVASISVQSRKSNTNLFLFIILISFIVFAGIGFWFITRINRK
jgi:hypothetical protein